MQQSRVLQHCAAGYLMASVIFPHLAVGCCQKSLDLSSYHIFLACLYVVGLKITYWMLLAVDMYLCCKV